MNQIKKYHLNDCFVNSTSIELLNYMNTYLYAMQLNQRKNKDIFLNKAKLVLEMEEMKEAKTVVKNLKYRNEHITYMLVNDMESLYSYEMRTIRRNRVKNSIKKLLLR